MRAPTKAEIEWEYCRRGFGRFLPYWHFKNRETGDVQSFRARGQLCPSGNPNCRCAGAGLWPGQQGLVDVYQEHPWVFALKAGKLGFTELECAWDAWVALFRHPNTRVHLFSKDYQASASLLRYVRFGLTKLPSSWGIEFMKSMAGGSTAKSLILRANRMHEDDFREIVSYPATGQVAIDQTAEHSHVDELSHMTEAEQLWNSVITTVAPFGSCHIVSRGAGDAAYSATLWSAANAAAPEKRGRNPIPFPYFAPFDMRPDRNEGTRREASESGSYTLLGLSYFLPRTPEEALAGDDESPYIPLDVWDTLRDLEMPELLPGDRTPMILSLDAAVTNDCFGVTGTTRHWDPQRHEEVAIRKTKKWSPDDFAIGEDGRRRIDFDVCEDWIRLVCGGGCRFGHPRSTPHIPERTPTPESLAKLQKSAEEWVCPDCTAGAWLVKPFNIVQCCYDPYQLEDMAQRLRRDGVVWMSEYDQGTERLIGDGAMFRLAMQRKLWHNGDPDLREHVGNAKAKLQPDEESKMRIIKKAPARKIDLAVSAAMGVKRCLELNI